MDKEQFLEIAIGHMKEIVDAYRQLGDDDYLNMTWCNGILHLNNFKPDGDTPEFSKFVEYPAK